MKLLQVNRLENISKYLRTASIVKQQIFKDKFNNFKKSVLPSKYICKQSYRQNRKAALEFKKRENALLNNDNT